YICLVNSAALVGTFGVLVQVVAAHLQQVGHPAQFLQVEPDGVSIQRHFPKVCPDAQNAQLCHLTVNAFQFRLADPEVQLLVPAVAHRSGSFFLGEACTGDFFSTFSCACLSCSRTEVQG